MHKFQESTPLHPAIQTPSLPKKVHYFWMNMPTFHFNVQEAIKDLAASAVYGALLYT